MKKLLKSYFVLFTRPKQCGQVAAIFVWLHSWLNITLWCGGWCCTFSASARINGWLSGCEVNDSPYFPPCGQLKPDSLIFSARRLNRFSVPPLHFSSKGNKWNWSYYDECFIASSWKLSFNADTIQVTMNINKIRSLSYRGWKSMPFIRVLGHGICWGDNRLMPCLKWRSSQNFRSPMLRIQSPSLPSHWRAWRFCVAGTFRYAASRSCHSAAIIKHVTARLELPSLPDP